MFLQDRICGVPKATKKGNRTSFSKKKSDAHIYKVSIRNHLYFKVQLHRGGKQKARYFKSKLEALIFVDMLRQNEYF